MDLGKIIKNKRLEMGLTQKELSDNICTQALISRIEKGDIIPKKEILDKLRNRLQLNDINLDEITKNAKSKKEVTQIKKTIRRNLINRDYETIELILNHNENLINKINDSSNRAFFLWINASLQDKLYNNKEKALEILNNISLNDLDDELAIEIMNAIGVIYYQDNDFDEALRIFHNAINIINETMDYKIKAKLMLNYALTLEEKNEDKQALEITIQTIDLLVNNDSIFLLGDLYHTRAHLLRKLGHLTEAKRNNQLALSIFEIQNNIKFKTMTQLEIRELENELKKHDSIDYMG